VAIENILHNRRNVDEPDRVVLECGHCDVVSCAEPRGVGTAGLSSMAGNRQTGKTTLVRSLEVERSFFHQVEG
jgi:hypothetical protein